MVNIAINGFGRIGRLFLRALSENKSAKNINVKIINDLADLESNIHLFKYDSVHGIYNKKIKKDKNSFDIGLGKTQIISEMEALIKKLYSDKEAMKKREEELARIRAERNKATTGNFAKMKGKLPWPVQGAIISKFGTSRNPITGVVIENVGIDIQANNGTYVKSVLDGVVSTITYIRGHGNIIIIDHGGGFSTVYAQIDKITVHENEYVQKGNTIASVVKAEDGSVSKLHFEVWGNQNKLNPQIWLNQQ